MNWRTITVAVDETAASNRALERAAEISHALDAKLLVTSVAPVLTGHGAAHGIGPFDPADPPELHQAQLEHAADVLYEKDVHAELEVTLGEPAAAIVSFADRHGSDLIVVGTRRPNFVQRLLSGSVSRSVARKAHCDVLIVQ